MNKSVYDAALRAAEKLHNEHRKKHGAGPLHLDAQLNVSALVYAKAVASGSPTPDAETAEYGRNEYQSEGEKGQPMDVVVKNAVNLWYSYIKEYNWDSPSKSSVNSRLFSQMVWASTKALGIGIVVKGQEIVVIALYAPEGKLSSDEENRENIKKPEAL